jgi:hypothetical protein
MKDILILPGLETWSMIKKVGAGGMVCPAIHASNGRRRQNNNWDFRYGTVEWDGKPAQKELIYNGSVYQFIGKRLVPVTKKRFLYPGTILCQDIIGDGKEEIINVYQKQNKEIWIAVWINDGGRSMQKDLSRKYLQDRRWAGH